jgi:hypothetical protein
MMENNHCKRQEKSLNDCHWMKMAWKPQKHAPLYHQTSGDDL